MRLNECVGADGSFAKDAWSEPKRRRCASSLTDIRPTRIEWAARDGDVRGLSSELKSLTVRHDVFVTKTNQGAPKWTCSMCGDEHEGLATVFGWMTPYAWFIDERSDKRKGDCDGDMCLMTDRKGGTHGYIRGHLRLRVHDPDQDYFTWSVWVELAKDEFNLNSDHWEDPERAQLLPSPGHLATVLPYEQGDTWAPGATLQP